jgi:hypothetical protein
LFKKIIAEDGFFWDIAKCNLQILTDVSEEPTASITNHPDDGGSKLL